MARPLNESQIRFCEEYVLNGFNRSKAYSIAYPNASKSTAESASHILLKRDDIQEYIESVEQSYREIGRDIGLDKKRVISRLNDMLQATKFVKVNGGVNGYAEIPDWTAINNAIVTFSRLTGDILPDKNPKAKPEEPVKKKEDLSNKSPEQIKKLKEDILKKMMIN